MSHSVIGLSTFSHSIAIIINFPKIRAKTVQKLGKYYKQWEDPVQWCSLPMGYN